MRSKLKDALKHYNPNAARLETYLNQGTMESKLNYALNHNNPGCSTLKNGTCSQENDVKQAVGIHERWELEKSADLVLNRGSSW